MTDQGWLKLLPDFVRLRIEGRHSFQKIIANTGWLFIDKILRMGVGLFVGVWIARYLGPEQFGLLNYVAAFVALFSVFADLGLDSIVVRDIVREPACAEVSLGTAFVLKLVGAFLTLLFSVGTICFLRPNDHKSLLLITIVASGAFFQAFDVIDYWYQSHVRSKYTVYARNAAFLAISLLKVILLWQRAPLIAFALAGTCEIALGACGLIFVYRRNGRDPRVAWRFCSRRAQELLRDCWPLLLSGLFVTLYIKIDQVMLGQMLGDEKVGVYSAAVRLTEMWYFIPMAIVSSVFPAIVRAKKTGEAQYYATLQKLFLLMIWLSVTVAVLLSLFSGPIVQIIFGSEYLEGSTALSIQCWSGIFIFTGSVSNLWYLLENLNRYTLYRHVLGAGINVLFNLYLIPRFGITGAAVATLMTQFGTSYLFDLFNRKTRIMFRIKSRYLFLFLPITVRYLLNNHAYSKDNN